ncbi:MAG: hypothetical protein WC165_03505 [Dysgonamonadaceae bacterium]
MNSLKNHMKGVKSLKMESLMLHGIGFVSGDPTIMFEYPFLLHSGMQINVTEPGNVKWIYMMLPLTKGSLIKEIEISCHCSDLLSRITHLRLVEQSEPFTSNLVHNEIIEEECFHTNFSKVHSNCNVIVNKSILLKLCLNFIDTDDTIKIGSVEVKYIPCYKQMEDIEQIEERDRYLKQIERQKQGNHKPNKTNANYLSVFLRSVFSNKLKEKHT